MQRIISCRCPVLPIFYHFCSHKHPNSFSPLSLLSFPLPLSFESNLHNTNTITHVLALSFSLVSSRIRWSSCHSPVCRTPLHSLHTRSISLRIPPLQPFLHSRGRRSPAPTQSSARAHAFAATRRRILLESRWSTQKIRPLLHSNAGAFARVLWCLASSRPWVQSVANAQRSDRVLHESDPDQSDGLPRLFRAGAGLFAGYQRSDGVLFLYANTLDPVRFNGTISFLDSNFRADG